MLSMICEGDLVVMDVGSFARREKTLRLQDGLLGSKRTVRLGALETIDELDSYLEKIIDEVEHGKHTSV